MSESFYGAYNLTSIPDTYNPNWCQNVTNINRMFYNCSSLTNVDISNWNISNVYTTNYMFGYCSSLTSIDVTNLNTSNLIGVGSMFSNCTSLINVIGLNTWDVSNVNIMSGMFANCTSLSNVDVSNWNVSNVTDMDGMFYNVPLNTSSYNDLLIGWSSLSPNLQNNVNFDANLAIASSSAALSGKDLLVNNFQWIISDATPT